MRNVLSDSAKLLLLSESLIGLNQPKLLLVLIKLRPSEEHQRESIHNRVKLFGVSKGLLEAFQGLARKPIDD